MKTSFDENTNSAAKKIIPAAAMLALSTVMLSTSTYAWFTMNKEVKMTGLNMTATAGEGMEISLAAIDSSNAISFDGAAFEDGHPKDEESETGWKSAVVVGNYYSDIGKLKPASSADGEKLFDATNASNSGKTASEFKELTLDDTTMAAVTKQTSFSESNTTITSDGTIGYYVDIPVHLRTSKAKSANKDSEVIYCKMFINDNNDAADDTLYKAVRVAFVPTTTSSGSSTKIFACDDEYYEAGAVNGTSSKTSVTIVKDSVVNGTEFGSGTGVDSGLKIPLAEAGKYGHLDFTVRIWLEGESKSCYDQTAGQSWNIGLAFSLGEFSTESGASNP